MSARVSKVQPQRGHLFPTLSGRSADGIRRATRDFYMRRNLAVVVLSDDMVLNEAAVCRMVDLRERVHAEAVECFVVAPPNTDVKGLPAIVDDGAIRTSLGVDTAGTIAIFILDRYGTIFATNDLAGPTPELSISDIPRWLEFVACRCS